jgi:hypothetical protein
MFVQRCSLCHGNPAGAQRPSTHVRPRAADVAACHCAIASALKERSVRRGIRWRRTLARAVAAVGTTQSLDRAVILLPFAGLLPGDVAVLRPSATAILFGTILANAARPLRDVLLRRGLKPGLTVTATWPPQPWSSASLEHRRG